MNGRFDELANGIAQTVMRRAALKKSGLDAIGVTLLAILCGLPSVRAAPGQQAYLKASNTGENDQFGWSVAISSNTMVVGAWKEASSSTGVTGNQNNNNAPDSGAAYVFVRNGTNWSQQAYLKASNTEASDYFGYAVAVSGDTVVVGAPGESSNATGVNGNQNNNSAAGSGAVYVFVRSGANWTQQAYLKASNTGAGDAFGCGLAVSGDTVVIGAAEDSSATGVNGNQSDNSAMDSGAAYVFVRSGSTWTQQAYLKASNTRADYSFGGGRSLYTAPFSGAVGVSGDTIVVGAYGESSNATGVNGNQNDSSAALSGAAYIFVRSGTNWLQQAYLKASNTEPVDFFGYSVAISGDTVVIGAGGESSNATGVDGDQGDNGAPHSGAAYVFVRTGTNWSQQAYLKASNTDSQFFMGPGDFFGWSVAVSGDLVAVSTPFESSDATGLNGDQNNNLAYYSGAAYAFVRSGTNWSQQTYIKASNAGFTDGFGYSAAAAGSTVVLGALGERSSATGVNGNQSDNSSAGSGAAYVFTGLGPTPAPRLTLARDGTGGYFVRFAGVPDLTYILLRGLSVAGPWSAIATNTAPTSGLVEFHDISPLAGRAFYRTVQP
jgi:hypothetical protein